mgnify:CR=1 FL=1
MKIIFLNCWYAKTGRVFFDFVKENSLNTDIFCFQEVYPKLFSKLQELQPNHVGRYATENKVELLGYVYGEAIFVKKGLDIVSSGKINLFRQVYNDVGYMQYANIRISGKMIYLANIHGKARPGHKLDTPARLRQSKLIIDFLENKPGLKIIGGDFNLLLETRSVGMFEEAGYRNLIKEFDIKDTRGKLSHRQFTQKDIQYFADYVFISPNVKVKSFSVPNIEVSDHLPLILDFEV